MQRKLRSLALSFIVVLLLLAPTACSTLAPPAPTSTSTPKPTSTKTSVPTKTDVPTSTPRPTRTPNLAATEHMSNLEAEAKAYFDQGYLSTADGRFREYSDFDEEWAQLGWYSWWTLNQSVKDFYISAHFKWTSAYRSADLSGCGFAFAIQPNEDHYAVFLDRSKIYFVETEYYYRAFSPTRGTGRVEFGNPFDAPVEADFTLIVNDTSAFVLVDGELVGEYTLAQS